MAALPPSNTPRYFMTYNVNGRNHTMGMRADSTVDDAAASTAMGGLLDALEPLLYSSTFVKFEKSAEGSNVRVPAVWTGPTEWGTGTSTPNAPSAFSFTGKDIEGHKFAVQVFGRNQAPNDDWRVPAVDDSAISDALEQLNDSTFTWLTINNMSPILNAYANQSMNAYWQRNARVN